MLIIDSTTAMARALDQPIDQDLKRLLALRRDQLLINTDDDLGALALFVVVAPGDALAAIEAAAGYPVVTQGAFEWVQRHASGWFEAVAILTDDGHATVLLVPDDEGVDQTTLALLREEAASGEPITPPINLQGQPTAP